MYKMKDIMAPFGLDEWPEIEEIILVQTNFLVLPSLRLSHDQLRSLALQNALKLNNLLNGSIGWTR